MARTIGDVFTDDIVPGLNFTFLPVPGGGGKDCERADVFEACAIDATNCVGGCTGKTARQLAGFVSCFEHSFNESSREHNCDIRFDVGTKCAVAAGIHAGMETCLASPDRQKKVTAWINATQAAASPKIQFWPWVHVNGKLDSDAAQNTTNLKKELCTAGLKAAC